ncbi:MAG: hypothetical protein H6Q69_3350 [Firmicutes bacterium]|nr:hypothetical protein [Bacillota bacterium]
MLKYSEFEKFHQNGCDEKLLFQFTTSELINELRNRNSVSLTTVETGSTLTANFLGAKIILEIDVDEE